MSGAGVAQAHWTECRLKNVAPYVNRGIAPSYTDEATGTIAFSQKCVRSDRTVDPSLGRPMMPPGDGASDSVLKPGDICINSTGTGTLGRAGLIEFRQPSDAALVADGHVTIIRPDATRVEPRFLWYTLATDTFYNMANVCLAVGSTNQTELSREAVRNVRVSFPALAEQRRIVEYLDGEAERIDTLIAEQERLCKLTLEMASARREWLFVQHLGAARPLLSFLRQPPTYGVLVPRFEDSGVPFVRVGDISDVANGTVPDRFISTQQSLEYRRTVLRLHDVLVSVVGSLGHASVVPTSLVGANVARAVCVLRPRGDEISPLIAEFVKTRLYQDQAVLATGTDTAQPTLNMSDLAKFRIPLPAKEEDRQELVCALEDVRRTSVTLTSEIESCLALLREHRQALITAAVTGGLDAARRVA